MVTNRCFWSVCSDHPVSREDEQSPPGHPPPLDTLPPPLGHPAPPPSPLPRTPPTLGHPAPLDKPPPWTDTPLDRHPLDTPLQLCLKMDVFTLCIVPNDGHAPHMNTPSLMVIVGYLIAHSVVPFLKNSLVGSIDLLLHCSIVYVHVQYTCTRASTVSNANFEASLYYSTHSESM